MLCVYICVHMFVYGFNCGGLSQIIMPDHDYLI